MISTNEITRYRVMERLREMAYYDPYSAYQFGYTVKRGDDSRRYIRNYLNGIGNPAYREAMEKYIVYDYPIERAAFCGTLKGRGETRASVERFIKSEIFDNEKEKLKARTVRKTDPERAKLLERIAKMF